MRNFEKVIGLLKEYKAEHGDCLVPISYTTEDGTCLGRIVSKIRLGYRKITPEEKAKLNSLGFAWKCRESVLSFNEVIILLKEYKEKNGDCLVPYSYTTEDGVRFGRIVNSIRSGTRKTNSEEKAKLNSLGFAWKVRETPISMEEVISLIKEYKKRNGDCLVPRAYITENGIHLGLIVRNIRSGARKTTPDEKKMLDTLGFVWKINESHLSFEEVVSLLKEYKEKNGDCLVSYSYTTEDGISLGRIVSNIRSGVRKTNAEEKVILDRLGFVWNLKLSFNEVIRLLKEYKEKNGDCLVPQTYTTEDGIHLGWIVNSIRSGARKITHDEKVKLNSLGFSWKVNESPLSFNEVIRLLKEYKEKNGDFLVPSLYTTEDGIRLGRIVSNIRSGARKTSADEKAILDGLGFVWKVRERRKS